MGTATKVFLWISFAVTGMMSLMLGLLGLASWAIIWFVFWMIFKPRKKKDNSAVFDKIAEGSAQQEAFNHADQRWAKQQRRKGSR